MMFLGMFMVFFILSLYAEVKNLYEYNDIIHNHINHVIIILLLFSLICIAFAGLILYGVTIDYVDASGDLQSSVVFGYQPFGFACLVFSFIPGLMLIIKVFEVLGSSMKQH